MQKGFDVLLARCPRLSRCFPLQGFSNVARIGSKPPHPRVIKSVVPVGRDRAQPAPRSFPLFWGGEGKRKKTFEKPASLFQCMEILYIIITLFFYKNMTIFVIL